MEQALSGYKNAGFCPSDCLFPVRRTYVFGRESVCFPSRKAMLSVQRRFSADKVHRFFSLFPLARLSIFRYSVVREVLRPFCLRSFRPLPPSGRKKRFSGVWQIRMSVTDILPSPVQALSGEMKFFRGGRSAIGNKFVSLHPRFP